MYEFDISGEDSLEQIVKRFGSFKKPLAEVGAFMERQTKRRFETETSPSGSKWRPLRPSTLARKKPGLKILTDSGILKAGIQFIPPTDTEVRVVANAEYAIYHQLGASRKNLSARPFMGFSKSDVTSITAIIDDYIING
jgi:phage virion morphogenesis protein